MPGDITQRAIRTGGADPQGQAEGDAGVDHQDEPAEAFEGQLVLCGGGTAARYGDRRSIRWQWPRMDETANRGEQPLDRSLPLAELQIWPRVSQDLMTRWLKGHPKPLNEEHIGSETQAVLVGPYCRSLLSGRRARPAARESSVRQRPADD